MYHQPTQPQKPRFRITFQLKRSQALTSHLLKSGSRALLNTSPEPVSNWTASVAEDAAVVGGLALAFSHPWLALGMVVAVSLSFALFVWWLWRRLFRRAPRPQAG